MKEPSLLRQIVSIHFEQAKRRKAIRILEKQSWSIDFLTLIMQKAAKVVGENIELVVTNKDGQSITMRYNREAGNSVANAIDDSILNHLDDDAAVNKFIAQNSRR